METVQQINAFGIDDSSNVYMTTETRTPSLFLNGSGYDLGRRLIFDVPRSRNNLSQINFIVSLTPSATGTADPALGTRIFAERIVRSKKTGAVLFRDTDIYCFARYKEMLGTPISNKISRAVSACTVGGACIYISPMFCWFSEFNKFLQTRYIDDLEVEVLINHTAQEMGYSTGTTVVINSVEAEFIYYEDVIIKPYKPMKMNGYRIYEEESVSLGTNSTTASVLLTCPYPVQCLYLAVKTAGNLYKNITNVKIESSNKKIIDMSSRSTFSLNSFSLGHEWSSTNSSTLGIWFPAEKRRDQDRDYINFTGPMYPCVLTVTYETTGASTEYVLEVISEYKQVFEFESDGNIRAPQMKNFDQSVQITGTSS